MRCEFTELDVETCSHCTGNSRLIRYNTPEGYTAFMASEDYHEAPWEKADYVETSRDRERQEIPNGEQFTTDVEMSEIYGRHQALRLRKVV